MASMAAPTHVVKVKPCYCSLEATIMTNGTLQQITRYPVKSMQGEDLESVAVSANGLAGDRRLALIDMQTNKVVSAKKPQFYRALLDCQATGVAEGLRVQLPDGKRLTVDEALPALSQLLDRELRWQSAESGALGSYASSWPRLAGLTMQGDHELEMAMVTKAVSFVDMAAVHLMTRSTLAHLQTLSPTSQIDARRFRPNFVIDADIEGFGEDQWVGRILAIGACRLKVSLLTPRCVMTTVAQPGLNDDIGVLRAAAENVQTFASGSRFACAGVYAEVIEPGAVQCGDTVTLLPEST
jgi:uncharacterized protein